MNKASSMKLYKKAWPYLTVIFLRVTYSGLSIIGKIGLNDGMSHYTFAVYRNAIAAVVFAPFAILFEWKNRPKMTTSICIKILILSLIEPVIDQNLYFAGLTYTSATFATAMINIVPAASFVMAWCFRLEQVNIKKLRSQAKIMGTLVTIGGAMIMTLLKGAIIGLPWTKSTIVLHRQNITTTHAQVLKGSFMVIAACFCWASFFVLQAITLKSYPAPLALTTLICLLGSLEGAALTLVVENGNKGIWAIGWDTKLLSALYGGIVCSGLGYYLAGLVMKERGPVFVTAFSPLTLVIVAILSSFILQEQIFVGTIVGAVVIVTGLYVVLWGKSKDVIEDSSTKSSICNTSDIPLHQRGQEDYEDANKKEESTHSTAVKIVPDVVARGVTLAG